MLLGLGLLAGSVALAQFGGLFAPDVPSVTVEELIAASEQGGFPVDGDEGRKRFLLVDVRDDNEHSVSLIPGAITRSDYESNRARYAAQRIVPYCTVGYRSGRVHAKSCVSRVWMRSTSRAASWRGWRPASRWSPPTARIRVASTPGVGRSRRPRGMSRSWIEPRINRGSRYARIDEPPHL
jgi:hypothetical protein